VVVVKKPKQRPRPRLKRQLRTCDINEYINKYINII
jgi:hypothetical protein